jgi:hypothetical protein
MSTSRNGFDFQDQQTKQPLKNPNKDKSEPSVMVVVFKEGPYFSEFSAFRPLENPGLNLKFLLLRRVNLSWCGVFGVFCEYEFLFFRRKITCNDWKLWFLR